MKNQRIKAIADAATLLFLRQGYSRTQISHIAKAVGVSVGAIYLDFSGKKAILLLILKSVLEPNYMEKDFERPITEDLFSGIEKEIVALFAQTEAEFARHLENNAADYCLEALVEDAFDLLARYAAGCLFIEKNFFDFPFLADHYQAFRQKFFTAMRRYLEAFIEQGTVRPLEHLELTTALIVETLTWWAMDRRYITFETIDVPLELAKKICLDNIVAAYKQK